MNLPKKLILLPTIALIFVGSGVAAYALKPEAESKRMEVQQAAAVEPVEEQAVPVESTPVVEQPAAQTVQEESPPSVTNPYIEGSNLWYVFNRRAELGRALPSGLGNASSWDNRAATLGLSVDKIVEIGAVAIVSSNGVAIVDAINADGSVSVSSMTDQASLLSANKASVIFYIH